MCLHPKSPYQELRADNRGTNPNTDF